MMKRYLYIFGILFFHNSKVLHAYTPIFYNKVSVETMLDSTSLRSAKTIQYYDGIGRLYQTAQSGIAPSGDFLYTMRLYDVCGRDSLVTLPWPLSADNFFFEAIPTQLLQQTYHTGNCYTENEYDVLNRPTFVSTPGTDWAGKGKSIAYITNSGNSVKYYESGTAMKGYFAAGALTGEVRTDEDGVQVTTFKDLAGRIILERRGDNQDTYYGYEKAGKLRQILQPKAQEGPASYYRFTYTYDSNGQLMNKALLSTHTSTYVYDHAGRLIVMQDPTRSSQSYARYFYYDGLGRVVAQGYSTVFDSSVQQRKDPFITSREALSGTTEICQTGYYAASDRVPNDLEIEKINYYDDYSFLNTSPFSNPAYASKFQANYSACTTSLLTGEITATSDGHLLARVYYYDDLGRVVDVRETMLNGDFLRTTTEYSFTDKPLCVQKYLDDGSQTYIFKECYTYDSQTDKELTHNFIYNGSTTNLNRFQYDDLGQVTSREQCNQQINNSYNYNVHGWLDRIETACTPSAYQQLFYQKLYYTDDLLFPGEENASYNGNIERMRWKMLDSGIQHGYKYYYDNCNRLTEARMTDCNFNENSGGFSERISYDKNCNITQLVRTATYNNNTILLDSLIYTYNANRVYKIQDYAQSPSYNGVFQFIPNSSKRTYAYNGFYDMMHDGNKRIAKIDYDYLGHPIRIQFTNGNLIEYVYALDGRKLRVKHTTAVEGLTVAWNNTLELTPATILHMDSIDYEDNIRVHKWEAMYNNTSQQFKAFEYDFNGGYMSIVPEISTNSITYPTRFHYNIYDYQGNVRLVVNDSCQVERYHNYYSYGGPYEETFDNSAFLPAKYNGKEYDEAHGLNWYDYGARMYDPAMARFTQMDPLCEQYPHLSPYAYCAGNPVRYVDPDGRHINVKKKHDGIYEILDGEIDDDLNIYDVTDGTDDPVSIGKALTKYSFFNDDGQIVKGAIIDLNDGSGQEFLDNFSTSAPFMPMMYYAFNAIPGNKFDFKQKDKSTHKNIDANKYHNRGMKVTIDGSEHIASARDIGNYAAGYYAGLIGLTWQETRLGFDALESICNWSFCTEGMPSQSAQSLGYICGGRHSSPIRRIITNYWRNRIFQKIIN